jgi:hypothetical protein
MYEEPRHGPLFLREASNFVEQAAQHAAREGTRDIYCPCFDCKNEKLWSDVVVIKTHLVVRGFVEGYTRWTYHGEEPIEVDDQPHEVDIAMDEPHDADDRVEVEDASSDEEGDPTAMEMEDDFDVEEMLCHIEPQVVMGAGTMLRGLDNFKTLQDASKTLLYDESKGCGKEFTVLRTVLEMMKLKAIHGWSDASFTELLELVSDLLPKLNLMPKSTYLAKKLISPLALGVQKIHACPNHCILYRNEYEHAV